MRAYRTIMQRGEVPGRISGAARGVAAMRWGGAAHVRQSGY